jgi:DNA-binding CsgD family transcriptional regulator
MFTLFMSRVEDSSNMGRKKKETAIPGQEYVDQCNGECWGKQQLVKAHGKNLFYGTCRHQCRLKNECIKASREEPENIQFQLSTIPYNPAIGDETYNEDGEPICVKETGSLEQIDEENGVDLDEMAVENFSSVDDFHAKFLKQHNVPEELYPVFREVTNQFFIMANLMPKFTAVLIGSAVGKMNQAELARREGLTRQAISAGIATEIARVTAPESLLKKLDGTERVIYDLFRQGYSLGWVAKKMKISKSKVYRVKRKFGAKIGKSETKVKIRLPWKKKSQNARKKARWREVQEQKEVKHKAMEMLEDMLKKMKG